MISALKKIQGLFSAACAGVVLAGCTAAPFAPISVPDYYSIRPDEPVDRAKMDKELKKLQNAVPAPYMIMSNDQFGVVVEGQPDMSRPVSVLPDGTINISPVGRVKIAGLTLPEAERLLAERYRKYLRLPKITLEPVKIHNPVFTISGAVEKSGIYPMEIGVTRLTDAILLAGGLAKDRIQDKGINVIMADLENSYIARNNKILPVDFVRALDERDPLHNIPIFPGDFIYLPPLTNGAITVLGEVKKSGCYPYQPSITLIQMMGLAGGLNSDTNCSEIKIIRGGLKNPVVYTLDVEAIQEGRAMDFVLKPLDIVYVPKDGLSKWNRQIKKLVPTAQLLSMLAGPFGNPSYYMGN